jgi:hypothetical protein
MDRYGKVWCFKIDYSYVSINYVDFRIEYEKHKIPLEN